MTAPKRLKESELDACYDVIRRGMPVMADMLQGHIAAIEAELASAKAAAEEYRELWLSTPACDCESCY